MCFGISRKDEKLSAHIHCSFATGVAWSQGDPWTFAAIAYDGKVSVHTVPKPIQYSIML